MSLNAASDLKTRKGRFYLPCPAGMSWDAVTGRWGQFNVADIVDSTKLFFSQLTTNFANPVVVASSIAGNTAVTQLRAGDVPDTIRRLRNNLVEQYTITSIP